MVGSRNFSLLFFNVVQGASLFRYLISDLWEMS
jgi:hypothetical protein